MTDSEIFLSPSILNHFNKPYGFNKVQNYSDSESILSEFEKKLQKILNTNKPILAVQSGTAAIHLALRLIDVKPDDEILCQSLTYIASSAPINYLGAKPVFIDNDESGLHISVKHLENAIKAGIKKNKKPKALIVASLYGFSCNYNKIQEICNKYEICLIDDSAESLGAMYKKKYCGTLGDFGIISFNNNKIITTGGGGVLICPNLEAKEKALYLATHAKENSPYYQHRNLGYNYRMSFINALIGIAELDYLKNIIKIKEEINIFYQKLFENIRGIQIIKSDNSDIKTNNWLSIIKVEKDVLKFDKEELRLTLLKNNIESRSIWKPMHLQPVYSNNIFFGNNNSERLFDKGLCLPSGVNLTQNELSRIEKTIFKLIYK